MRLSSLQRLGRHIKLRFQVSVLSRGVGGWGSGVGVWVGEINIKA